MLPQFYGKNYFSGLHYLPLYEAKGWGGCQMGLLLFLYYFFLYGVGGTINNRLQHYLSVYDYIADLFICSTPVGES